MFRSTTPLQEPLQEPSYTNNNNSTRHLNIQALQKN